MPHTVAVATLVYSAYTFIAMALFGSEKWLERGETFSVYFGMFASLAPFEVRDRRLGLRRMLSASTRWVRMPGSVAMILVTIGATTFDGAAEGVLKEPINKLDIFFADDLGFGPIAALRATNSIFMILSLALVAGLFWAGIYGMHTVKTSFSTPKARRAVRARVHPDRARLPDRPLLQPRLLPGAGAVRVPALRPAR